MDFVLNKEITERLISTAKKYADFAYCPYSGVAVGSALLMSNGDIFGGCNIENGDYSSPSYSAGDTALVKAISEGRSDLHTICFYSEKNMAYPNAVTRENFYEFNPEIKVIVANSDDYKIIDSISSIYLFPSKYGGSE
jgi:cytidine deaminase